MIIVAGTFRFDPAKREQLEPAARIQVEKTRAEEGCQVYSFAFDVSEPDLLRIYEVWDSADHLRAHLQAPHMADWRAAGETVGVHDRNVKTIEVDGEFGPLPPSEQKSD